MKQEGRRLSKALDVLASLVLEDGRTWGSVATADQWADARAILSLIEPPFHFLTRSRGYSKTTDLAAVLIAFLITFVSSRSYGLASDIDQAGLLIDAIRGFCERTPFLRGTFDITGTRVTHRKSGATFETLAADAPGAWGLRPSFVVVDEIAQWAETTASKRLWEAVTSAMTKVDGAKLVVLTTAGDPSHFPAKILQHAKDDELWRVHEVAGPPPWADPARLEEQKRRLPESSYRRLFLNEWTAGEDRLTNEDDLAACVTLDGPLEPQAGKRYIIGLDVGLSKDRTVATIAHAETVTGDDSEKRSRVVIDRQQVWAGTRKTPVQLTEVEAWLREASKRFNNASFVFDPWQSAGTAQRLREKGYKVREYAFSQSSVSKLAICLHNLIRGHLLAIPDDAELLDELANVRLRETSPGVYRMDHHSGRHDDRAISLALAANALVESSARVVEIDGTGFAMANDSLVASSGFTDQELPAHLALGEEYDVDSAWDIGL